MADFEVRCLDLPSFGCLHLDGDGPETPRAASLDELKDRLIVEYGEVAVFREAVSHKELIVRCL